MNKFQACRVAVASISAIAIVGMIVLLFLNASNISDWIAFTFGTVDLKTLLYIAGPYICGIYLTITTPILFFMFTRDEDVIEKVLGDTLNTYFQIYSVISIVCVYWVFLVGAVLQWLHPEGTLNVQYGLSMVPSLVIILVFLIYETEFAKYACRRFNKNEE